MTGINLSLPIDIPWKQIATSGDMMDPSFGASGYPPKWRSSLAIYAYDAVDLPEELQDRRITYFKVVASITGYQTDAVRRRKFNFGDIGIRDVGMLEEELNKYYACYGVLLQVGVAPSSEADRADLGRYPIIVDFDPKRRDLYEVATDTGEILSGSSNRAAVQKGFTSTANSESTIGVSATGGYSPGQAGGLGGSLTGSFSDKSSFGTQDSSVTSIDHAREKRESQSHTTSITQMYNLLQGYHLGTNRAVYLLSPRPHVLEEVEKRTFINGPREIEGVQEFFFVTSRPADVENICIEAFLETGHLDMSPAESATQAHDEKSFAFDFQAPREIEHGGGPGDDSTSQSVVRTETYTPPAGWEVDVDKGDGGYVLAWVEGAAAVTVNASSSSVSATATVITTYHDVQWPSDNYYSYQNAKGEVRVFLRKKKETGASDVRNTFFVTSRRVAGCTGAPMAFTSDFAQPDWVAFEHPLAVSPAMFSVFAPTVSRMRLANDLQRRIARLMLESQHARPRYRPGAVQFEQSQFVLDRVVRLLRRRRGATGRPPAGGALRDAPLPTAMRGRLARAMGDEATLEDVLALPAAQLLDLAGYATLEEAVAARWKLLGVGPRTLPK